MTDRFYAQGERDGFKYYAPCYSVFNQSHRVLRTMNAAERASYDAGYKAGKGRVDGRRLVALGYGEAV